jgi:transposase
MEQPIRFIGLDVHKDTIVVAITAAGETGKATAYGIIPNTSAALLTLVTRLRQASPPSASPPSAGPASTGGTSGPMRFCYEAGPCGYGIHRTLTALGEDCVVVAPSMIPRKSGERRKNDKRDAAALAQLHRGGLLTAIWVPDTAHEAMRDLIRARLAAVRAARQQLSAFLLRHERVYPTDKTTWTKAHRRWLADQSFAAPAQQIVLQESIEAVHAGEQRRDRVDGHLRAQIPGWPLYPGGPVATEPKVRFRSPG